MKYLFLLFIIAYNSYDSGLEFESENSFGYFPITQEKDLKQSIKDGQGVYSGFCMRCHLAEGEGVEGIYPPLANSNWLSEKRMESIKSIKYGLKGEIVVNGKTYNNNMTSMGLTDREVADVMNYVMNSFGNEDRDISQVTLDEVLSISEEE
jgi:mono/diheme cytochrome c family protein